MRTTREYVKGAGDLLGAGLLVLIGLAVAFVVALFVIVALLVKIFFFPSEKAPEIATPVIVSPAAEIEYPKVTDLCFRTPMGDVGKVIAQQNDMLEMTFRGGVKSTYQFNQVSHADCGVLPAN